MNSSGEAAYKITYKRIKNLILRVNSDGTLSVSAPYGVSEDQINHFVRSKEKWIESRLRKLGAKREFLDGKTIHLLGSSLILVIKYSEKESVHWLGDEIVIQSKNPEDSAYNQKLFYRKFSLMIERVFRSLLDDEGGDAVVLKTRDMKRRWGTCFVGRNSIQLNKRLIHAPKELISYVIIHELVHFSEPHHGSSYYVALAKRLPDWKQRKVELNNGYSSYL
jgi:hypothetical protein